MVHRYAELLLGEGKKVVVEMDDSVLVMIELLFKDKGKCYHH